MAQWDIAAPSDTVHFVLQQSCQCGAEMRALLRKAGFRDIKLYGNWYPVTRFTRHSSRIIAVGKKPN